MKFYTILLATLVLSFSAIAQEKMLFSVYFETAKHDLTSTATNTLMKLTQEVSSMEDFTFEILAHTDNRGSVTYNQALANRRAASVEKYLAEYNITIQKTTVSSFGEKNPTYSNDTEEGRKNNRRVDVIVKPIAFENTAALFSKLQEQKQQIYTINIDEKQIIKGKEGTILTIPEHAFEYKNESGSPTGNVEIHLEEAYTYGDLIALQFTTVSDGKMLETGGSIHIEATSNGKALKLKSDKTINVKMPATNAKKDMTLFVGNRTDDGNINWKNTNQPFRVMAAASNSKENSFRRAALPVVLDENEEIDTKATKKLYNSDADLNINSDLVPCFDYGRRRDPIFKGYIPADLNEKWNLLLNQEPVNGLREPRFSRTKPKEPKREDIKYDPSLTTKLKLGKKGLEAKKEEMYQRKLKGYQKRLARYETEKSNFDQRLTNYNKGIEGFKNNQYDPWKVRKDSMEALIDRVLLVDDKRLQIEMYNKTQEERKANFEAKIENNEKIEDIELQSYVMDINQLGFINCDKFPRLSAQRQPVIVKGNWVGGMIYVIVHKFKSVIFATNQNGFHKTQEIPKNTEITIIGIKNIDGKVMLGKMKTKSGVQDIFTLDYKESNLSELKKELSDET